MWLVEGGNSSSSGPAVPDDVEETALVRKLVAPPAPTAADREEHTARGHAVFRTWMSRMLHRTWSNASHRAGGTETTIPAIATDCGYSNERDDQLQETSGAPILEGKCDRDRWIGHAVAEHKKGVSGGGFAEVLARSDNEPAILALKESTATALKLSGVTVKTEALYDSQSNGLKDVKGAVRTKFGLPCLALRTGVPSGTSGLALACEVLHCGGEQTQDRSRWQDSLRAQVRASS